nr:hypothetical protein [Rhodococcus sp. KBS0724]
MRSHVWMIRLRGIELITAAEHAGLRGPDGTVLMVTPHQLRHTRATEIANTGMSLQALMHCSDMSPTR